MPIKRFVGLISKKHTFIIKDNHESNKAKSSNKKNNDDELKHKGYKKCLGKKMICDTWNEQSSKQRL